MPDARCYQWHLDCRDCTQCGLCDVTGGVHREVCETRKRRENGSNWLAGLFRGFLAWCRPRLPATDLILGSVFLN